MFAPRLIFSALWLSQVVLHGVLYDAFVPFDLSTWIVIAFSLIFFNLGTVVADHLGVAKRKSKAIPIETSRRNIRQFIFWFVLVYLVSGFLAGIELYGSLQELGAGLNLPRIREVVIQDFSGDRVLYNLFRVFYLGVGFCIFFVAFSNVLSIKQLVMILVIGLMSALITTGRLYLMLYFLSVTALLYRAKIVSLRGVLAAALGFIALFFLVAVLLGKGDDDGVASVLDSVLWNSQVYFMSSVSCFNDFLMSGTQKIEGGALLPNPVRELLSIVGFGIPPKPALLPFSEVPVPCNTYTFMFPLFHDGSFIGVALGSFLIGIFHQFLYLKSIYTARPVWSYFYAISIYAIFMTIFEDAYFSSPGFWLTLIIPPFTYYLFGLLRRMRVA